MKRLSVYGQARGRAVIMQADVWANLGMVQIRLTNCPQGKPVSS
jgi:hypothetical protein